jgi:hypothetical protein
MATLNEIIKPSHHAITDVVKSFRDGSYAVDDRYQRRLVWTPKQKVRLIETILMGYPMPEIYLHQLKADAETGEQIFSIVDGQQRITTIVQFVSNEWKLGSAFLNKENRTSAFANVDWDGLASDLKEKLWGYTISSRIIPPQVTYDQIKTMFTRLNESDKSLNPQELRHAEFSGKIIKLAERLSNIEFWEKWSVFTPNDVRRMADVEFATSLISFLRNGVVSDTTESINHLYDMFNTEYEFEKSDEDEIKKRLNMIDTIFSEDERVSKFFSKPVHLYTLFTALDPVFFSKEIDLSDMCEALHAFVDDYETSYADDEIKSVVAENYRKGAVQRTRSRTSRLLRGDALLDFITFRGL